MKCYLLVLLFGCVACGADKVFDGVTIIGAHDAEVLWGEVGDVGAEIVRSALIYTDGTPDWELAQDLHDNGVQITLTDNASVRCGGESVAGCTHQYKSGSIEIAAIRGHCDIAGPLGSHELLHVALLQATGDGDAKHAAPDVWGEVGLEGHLQAFVGGLCVEFPD